MPFANVFSQLFTTWSVIAGVVFALVTGILLVSVVLNAAKRREKPLFRASANTPVEVTYIVVLTGVAAALVVGSTMANARLHDGEGSEQVAGAAPQHEGDGAGQAERASSVARIDVEAYRWCWDFAYRDAPVRVTGECTSGELPTVVVPAGQPVEFNMTSRDVVHAFWLPDFAAKRDVNPDHVNTLRMTFPEEGQWRGRCSEFCGTHHVTMDFHVRAVSPEEYQEYLQSDGATA